MELLGFESSQTQANIILVDWKWTQGVKEYLMLSFKWVAQLLSYEEGESQNWPKHRKENRKQENCRCGEGFVWTKVAFGHGFEELLKWGFIVCGNELAFDHK